MNFQRNIEINDELQKLYEENSAELIKLWSNHFKSKAFPKIGTFGIVDPENYDTDNGILFIAKETRGEVTDFLLWLNTMATKFETLEDKDRTKHPQIWYNIGRWAKFINNPKIDKKMLLAEKQTALEGLKTIAFTNINKVYGKSSSQKEFWKLANVPIVQTVLQREIETISPRIIVLCGNGLRDTLKNIKTDAIIIEMPHPSARCSKEKMLNQLESQLKGCDIL